MSREIILFYFFFFFREAGREALKGGIRKSTVRGREGRVLEEEG